jgi:integrase
MNLEKRQNSHLTQQNLVTEAQDFMKASLSPATRVTYDVAWRTFSTWCDENDFSPKTLGTPGLILFLTSMAQTKSVPTILKTLAGIRKCRQLLGTPLEPSHELDSFLRGLKRMKAKPQTSKEPLTTDLLKRICKTLNDSKPRDLRDRALILTGFCGALRRSEIAALTIQDFTKCDEGFVLTIQRSKTDQFGQGEKLGIPYGSHRETCPVRSIKAWLDFLSGHEITTGPIFRHLVQSKPTSKNLTGRGICLVVQRLLKRIEVDPTNFGAHSLRSGFATSAARAGVSTFDISAQTRHRSIQSLDRYVKRGQIFEDNPVARLGL